MFHSPTVIRVLTFSISAFVSIMVGAWVYQSQQNAMTHAEGLLLSSLETWGEAVALSLSTFDYNSASRLVESLEEHPEILGLQVFDRNNFLVASITVPHETPMENLKEISMELVRQTTDEATSTSFGEAKFTITSKNVVSVILVGVINGVIAGAVVGVTTAIVLNIYISQFVTKPLRHFFDAVEETSRTGEHARVAYLSESRLGQLASGFNMMQEQLEKESRAQQELNKKNIAMNTQLAQMLDDYRNKQREQEWQLEAIGRILKRNAITLTYIKPDGEVAFASQNDHPVPIVNQMVKNPEFDFDLISEKLKSEKLSARFLKGAKFRDDPQDSAFNIEIEHEDGRAWQLLASGQDAEGRIVICGDVSDQRKLERDLRHQQKMDALGRLTGGIAHEVNNMLAIAYGGLQLLQNRTQTSDAEIIDSAVRSIERASSTISQLLTYSRKKIHKTEVIDLSTHMDGLLSMLDRVVGPRISVRAEIDEGISVLVDPDGLDGAIVNLATNARDAMNDGGSIELRARKVPKQGTDQEFCVIEFSDDGSGIEQADIEQIFDPFFSTKITSDKGLGLGLSVVAGFVRASGGKVTVQSSLGKGTTFFLELPVAMPAQASEPVEHAQDRPLGGRCLVVDDEPLLLNVTGKIVESLGFKVELADSVTTALQHLSNADVDEFDLLVSDVHLKDGNGTKIVDTFLNSSSSGKAIIVSGYHDMEANFASDRCRFLQKPYTISSIKSEISGLMKNRQI